MKTKNIFRMLLVAVALLLGANNVKADETTVWEGTFDMNNVVSVDWNNNVQVSDGDKIRIYVFDRNLHVNGQWSTSLELVNGRDGYPSFSSYNTTGNYYELKFAENSISTLKQQGLSYNKSSYFTITKVTIADANGNENEITNDMSSGKFQDFTVNHAVRFYGTHSTYGYLFTYAGWGDSYVILKSSNNNLLECTAADANNGYIEATIDADGIDSWKNRGGMKIRHSNNNVSSLGVSKVTVVSGNDDSSTKTNVTLTYSATTASATTASIGQTLAGAPTLTVSPEGLEGVTYSSSNTDVATVAADGTVTIVGAGTTTITATFAETDTHKGATASYTLTVSKQNVTLSFSQETASAKMEKAFTPPTLTVSPEGLEGITYSSSNTGVATVSNDGSVTLVSAGTTTITASFAETAV